MTEQQEIERLQRELTRLNGLLKLVNDRLDRHINRMLETHETPPGGAALMDEAKQLQAALRETERDLAFVRSGKWGRLSGAERESLAESRRRRDQAAAEVATMASRLAGLDRIEQVGGVLSDSMRANRRDYHSRRVTAMGRTEQYQRRIEMTMKGNRQ